MQSMYSSNPKEGPLRAEDRFTWRSFDVRGLLPPDWREACLRAADRAAMTMMKPSSVTSRETDPDSPLPIFSLDGFRVRELLPWAYEFYQGLFREFAALCSSEPVLPALENSHGAVLNVLRGNAMRYECHVDSNPIEGLLYITDNPPGTGGELVVANSQDARSVEDVDRDASVIYPVAGNLIFFDGRRFAHYVRPLKSASGLRVVLAMNYYTESSPESARPKDLDRHLFPGS